MIELKCKKCNSPLEHYDTIDTDGGLEDDFYVERQIWGCDKCSLDYVVEKQIKFNPKDVNIIYFEEG